MRKSRRAWVTLLFVTGLAAAAGVVCRPAPNPDGPAAVELLSNRGRLALVRPQTFADAGRRVTVVEVVLAEPSLRLAFLATPEQVEELESLRGRVVTVTYTEADGVKGRLVSVAAE
jgi:hypothetical protein